jgi:hypothetical protein
MKRIYFRSLVVVALGTMIIGCSKEESAPSTADNKTMDVPDYWAELPVTIPLDTEFPAGPIPTGRETVLNWYDREEQEPNAPFTVIETPTAQYLDETCLFDFSKQEFGKSFTWVKNKNVNLGFHRGMGPNVNTVKLSTKLPPVEGWDLPWGNLPEVQGQPKEILFVQAWFEFFLVFSKPITEFGVEIAPNKQNYDSQISVSLGKMEFDASSGQVTKNTRTPGGAKFFGLKATKPFTTITVRWLKSTGTDLRDPEGFALANIRYKLAK